MSHAIRIIKRLLAGSAAALFCAQAWSATCDFIGPSGGQFALPTNWSCAAVPGNTDIITINGKNVDLGSVNRFVLDAVMTGNVTLLSTGPAVLDIQSGGSAPWGTGIVSFNNVGLTVSGSIGAGLDASASILSFSNGSLNINNSGTAFYVGNVAVNGASATVNNFGFYSVGGVLNLTGGAVFNNGLGGVFAMGSPSVTIDGPVNNAGRLHVIGGTTLTLVSAATFAQTDPSASLAGDGVISAAGQILAVATGRIEDSLTLNVGTVMLGGELAPGSSGAAGVITINGNLVMGSGSQLSIKLAAGPTTPVFDRVVATGAITIGIDVPADIQDYYDLGNGFYTPTMGDTFAFLQGASVVGSFANSPPGYAGFGASFAYTGTAVQMLITALVTNTNDSGPGSLRDALSGMGGCDFSYIVTFDLGPAGGTIQPLTPLPTLDCGSSGVDGYSHPGATPNTAPTDWNANLKVTLDGSLCAGCSEGLHVAANNALVTGINFTNWSRAIFVDDGSSNAQVMGNYFFQGNRGIVVVGNGNGIRIGDSSRVDSRNVFVHAMSDAIRVEMFTGFSAPRIENNFIGLGAGAVAGPNTAGVVVASANGVQLRDNVIANNGKGLVVIAGTTGTQYRVGNKIFGNTIIGVDINDDGPTPNDDLSPPYDTDGNDRPNFPVINSATDIGGGTTRVDYTLKSTPNLSTYVCFCGTQNLTENQCRSAPVCTGAMTDGTGTLNATFDIPQAGQFALPSRITAFQQPESGPKTNSGSEISPGVNVLLPVPAFSVSPATLNFGGRIAGTTGTPQTFTVTNTGGGIMTISAVISSAPFTLVSETCTGMPMIAPMATCTAVVRFDPTVAGLQSGTLTFTSNATGSPHGVMLGGTGLQTPTIGVALSPSSIAVGGTSLLTLTLNNVNGNPLAINLGGLMLPTGVSVAASPPPTTTCGSGVSASGQTISFMTGAIPAMGSCTVSVPVQGTAVGAYPVTFSAGSLQVNEGPNTVTSSAFLTVTGSGPFGYIANFNNFTGSTVTAIDLPTNTVAATIPVGLGPVGVSVNYAGTRAYVANQQANNVGVIDTATNTVIATIPVGSQPGSVGVNPADTRVFAPNQTSNSVSVIDTSTNTVIATVAGLNFPSAAVFNPSGSKAYVNQSGANLLTAIDATTNTVIGSVAVCSGPYQQVVNATGTRIYVVCSSGNVSVVDTSTFTVIATVPVGSTSRGIAITPDGSRVWVSNSGSNNVSVIDTTSNTVVATLTAGTTPWGVAGNAAGTRMYVVNNGSNTVSVFDTATNTVVATVPTGTGPLTIGQFLQPAAVASNPLVSLSPAVVAFGSRTVMTTSPPTTVTLSNSGTAPLLISGIASSGDFGFTSTCPILTPPLAIGANCQINITFTPLTVAALTGTVTVTSNAPGSPHAVSLTGTGVPIAVAGIALSATALSAGSVVVNTGSAQQVLTVTNSGLATLNLTSVTVSGPFARVVPATGTNCGASLAPAATCRIAVVCSPTAVGSFTGVLSIVHNAAGSPSNVNLDCSGIPAPFSLIALPTTLDFVDQVVNNASAARTVVISNGGTATLNVSNITLSGAQANEFALSGACTAIAPAGSCALTVIFTPRATGARSAQLSIASDALNGQSVNAVRLTGNGVLAQRPIVNLSVTTIGYGNAVFGGASGGQLVTLKNEGGAPLAIGQVAVTGDFLATHNCGNSLASLASCTITVTFVPGGIGGRQGELQLFSDALGSPHRVPLSGTGCRWFSQATSRFFLTICG